MKHYLSVPYNDNRQVMLLGAYWDNDVKKWYYKYMEEEVKFKKWLIKESTKDYSDLSAEQQYFISAALKGRNILVDACIGSGKTTTIQCLCNLIKDKKVLYLTYNALLKVDARNKIMQSNVLVTNYHGFCFTTLNDLNIKNSPNNSVQKLLEVKPQLPAFDIIIIDEYQDIEQEFADLLLYIKSFNANMQIIMVGDMSQKIYDKTTLDVLSFIPTFMNNYETIYFTQCFRLSEKYAKRLGDIWHKNIVGVNHSCNVTEMTFNEVYDYLCTKEAKEIICLGSRQGQMSYLLNKLEHSLPAKFNKNTVYATIDDVDKNNITPDAKVAIFTSFDSSKGMERPICVVCDFTEEYWKIRTSQPMAKYDITRNIFLVAASRGKKQIIFVRPKTGSLLKSKTLEKPTLYNLMNSKFYASDMFSFKYVEDVMKCYNLLKITPIEENNDVIDIDHKDGLIDLSPAIGIYQQACFFKNYDIQQTIDDVNDRHEKPALKLEENDSLQYKILNIVAANTHYQRYKYQVKLPFISDFETKLIRDRLSKIFIGDEIVEKSCSLSFKGQNICHINGRCDVLKNDIPYELKFVYELAPEHYLQAAFYAIAMDKDYSILWNVRNDNRYKIEVLDRDKFLDEVINCITKGTIKKFKI